MPCCCGVTTEVCACAESIPTELEMEVDADGCDIDGTIWDLDLYTPTGLDPGWYTDDGDALPHEVECEASFCSLIPFMRIEVEATGNEECPFLCKIIVGLWCLNGGTRIQASGGDDVTDTVFSECTGEAFHSDCSPFEAIGSGTMDGNGFCECCCDGVATTLTVRERS